jgi:hypothetical protein
MGVPDGRRNAMRSLLLLACPVMLASACEDSEWWTSSDCIGVQDDGSAYEFSVGDVFCVNLGMSGGLAGRAPDSRYDVGVVELVDRHDTQPTGCCDLSGTLWERFSIVGQGQTLFRVCESEFGDCTDAFFEFTVRGVPR